MRGTARGARAQALANVNVEPCFLSLFPPVLAFSPPYISLRSFVSPVSEAPAAAGFSLLRRGDGLRDSKKTQRGASWMTTLGGTSGRCLAPQPGLFGDAGGAHRFTAGSEFSVWGNRARTRHSHTRPSSRHGRHAIAQIMICCTDISGYKARKKRPFLQGKRA